MDAKKVIKCPRGSQLIDPEKHSAYQWEEREQMHRFLRPDTARRLDAFLTAFTQFREERGDRMKHVDLYPQLPFVAIQPEMWRLRQMDLEIIEEKRPSGESLEVLEVGAWNNWLSHQLSKQGHAVTALDFFADEFDGLGARQHYPEPQWVNIQMDLRELEVIEKEFDLIVLNRCLYTVPDQIGLLAVLRQRLKAGGMIIMTGINQVKKLTPHQARLDQMGVDFEKKYGTPFGIFPLKAAMDKKDRAKLESFGVKFMPYPKLRKANLINRVRSEQPRYLYALYRP